ncbi:hypothetical protein GALL_348340 [mine drainage metagenome]|uniref:Uncharacterized protein n=1 Tax=mine drainage metagenome TaxID=410659 RepID=A0A1J5R5A9_9ZZZZ
MSVIQRGAGDVFRLHPGVGIETVDFKLSGERLQLLDGGGAIDVGADQQHLLLLFLEQARQLGGGGGLARALQAGHQDDRRRYRRQIEGGGAAAHQSGQFLMHHLNDRLARRQALQHLTALGALLDVVDEVLDHGQGDVGLQQGHAHFAHRVLDVLFGQACLAAQGFDDAGKAPG